MTSTAGSTTPSVPDRAVTRAAVVTHGKTGQIGAGLARLQAVASEHAVELLFSPEESEKHALDRTADPARADIAVVLGGDGTMLRALTACAMLRKTRSGLALSPRGANASRKRCSVCEPSSPSGPRPSISHRRSIRWGEAAATSAAIPAPSEWPSRA